MPEDLPTYGSFVKLFKDKDSWLRFLADHDAWRMSPPYGKMRLNFNTIRKLSSLQCRCIIVTSNSHLKGQLGTVEWIHENLREMSKEGIDIHFVNDKMQVDFDAIVEDSLTNAFQAARAGRLAFVVKRPWTQFSMETYSGQDWMRRVVVLPNDGRAIQEMTMALHWWWRFRDGKKQHRVD